MTILDLGAGCGETAAFYLAHGARKVIAVEPNPEAFSVLKLNASTNGWKVDLINEPFSIGHLSLPHDFMKMDIEGAEAHLILYDGELKPLVIEAHSDGIAKNLIQRFNLKRVFRMTEFGHPQLSLLHRADSPLPQVETGVAEYLGIARVAIKERIGI